MSYVVASAARSASAPATKRLGFLARLYAKIIVARSRQVEQELKRYGHLLPSELEQAGARIGQRNEDSLPFQR
jgi:hypothetical protein